MTTGRRNLGISQGMAAGFMISVTVGEIIPEALGGVSVAACMLYVCTGAIFIYLLKHLLPEPDLSVFLQGSGSDEAKHQTSLSLSGGDPEAEGKYTSDLGSSSSRRRERSPRGGGSSSSSLTEQRFLWSGLLIAMSLAAHNLPEGMATYVAAQKGLTFGLPLTVAIALHNIPEGAACALPVYLATRSRRKAVLVAFLSGLAEPLGVVFVYAIGPASLTPPMVGGLLAVVGGIMGGLSIFELGPQSVELTSKRDALASVALGFVAMTLVLMVLHV